MKPKKKIKFSLDNSIVSKLYDDHLIETNKIIKEYDKFFDRTLKICTMEYNILRHKNSIWLPTHNINISNVLHNSWFSIHESKPHNIPTVQNNHTTDEIDDVKYKSKKIILKLTNEQKNKIDKWLNAYLDMYNIALKYIKDNIDVDKKVLNYIYLRAKLKTEKEELVKKSKIKVHDIDYAIDLVCKNYKSAITNYKKGNIKTFRIRYWRKNKNDKIMEMEKNNFTKNTIRNKELGKVYGYYNGKEYNFNEIDCDCKLQKKDGGYYLYVPELVSKNDKKNKKEEVISLDPGIRKFFTGISEKKIIKIGGECGNKIKDYLIRKDKIQENKEISEKIKKKNEKMINKKIKNLVTELHWKSINYLTKNYNTILIGDMSTKGIVSNNGNLNKLTKRVAYSLEFYKYHQRLKYKCKINDVEYGKINEYMTSKMCSNCGELNEKLGSNEIYECEKCKIKLDRDINGARNIFIKSIK